MSDSSSLTSWVKNSLAPLYEANSNTLGTDFDRSFESVFASGAEIVVNHNSITRDELKKNLQERSFAATRGSIEWKDLIEISSGDSSSETGIVAGSFIVTRSLKFRIRAAPAQTNNQTIFSVKIEQDPSHEGEDRRRIVQIFLTSVDKAAPIHLQSSTS